MSKWSQLGHNYRAQLENWIVWTRRNTGKPKSYGSVMKFSSSRDGDGDNTMPVDPIVIVCELDAENFDRLIINSLSKHQLEIFKVAVIDRVKKRSNNGCEWVKWRDMSRKYSLLGLTRSTYERRLEVIERDLKHIGDLV